MRIGVDIREFEKGRSTGIGRYLRNFLAYACKNDEGNDYILYGNQKTDCPEEFKSLNIRILSEGITFFWDQWHLPRALEKDKIDTFFSPYYKGPLTGRVKKIIVIHDLNHLMHPEYQTWDSFLPRMSYKAYLNVLSRRMDRVLTVSENSKEDIVSQLNIKKEKIKVVFNAVDSTFHPILEKKDDVFKKLNIDKDYIFYFGNFNPHKNVQRLIKSYAKLEEHIRVKYSLVIGGRKDKYYSILKDMTKALGVNSSVSFIGSCTEEDLPHLYNQASCFVFPSLCEGFGLPVLEAMACGTPVVTSNGSSLPEVVGEAALLVDGRSEESITKALKDILENEELRQKLRAKGIERARHFSMEKMGEGILEVFKELQK